MVDLKEAKSWSTIAITADLLLSKVPGFVRHICLTAGTQGAATVLIYDGVDANAPLKLALSAIASTHFQDDFDIPVYFEHGIYIDIGDNVTLFNLQYKEERG